MSNPVFNRIDQESRRGYAGFGDGRPTQSYGQPYGAPQGYQTQRGPVDMNASQLDDLYNAPSAGPVQSRRLTLDDVLMKSGLLFGIMLLVAGGTWAATMATMSTAGYGLASLATLTGAIVTLVLGLIVAFSKKIRPALIVTFAVFEGLMVGGISTVFAQAYDGVVTTAIVATLSVFVAMFLGWKTNLIRVTSRSRRIFGMAIFGYFIFMLVNFGFALFGANSGWGIFAGGSTLGILVSVFAVGLASYSLAIDFDSIDRAVRAGAPEKYSWLLAHGLLVTVVWLYIEMLRLLGHLQQR
ncbi:Bax inhibitor-1/YccA family protein [Mobilicoccus massiliensis]|uniref:Bax inhibitor-1/YccA family protein n=1 Tax=Mobilicoccus massiliensis TaxID=1522310 RepID=UPI00058F64CE|nr:Bax inhibitor-1/YccA family protein [Mobilicoccus massiliensis]